MQGALKIGKHNPWRFDDGGRADAGYKGGAGDCVARSLAIAMQLPYQEVYDALAHGNATQRVTKKTRGRSKTGVRTASRGINTKRKWFSDWMEARGWKWTPTMRIGSGCRVHLLAHELPAGRLIVNVARHYTAVIDGVIHDTFDPNDRPEHFESDAFGLPVIVTPGPRCVYGYWSKA